MIKISKSTHEEIKDIEEAFWKKQNKINFGKAVGWDVWPIVFKLTDNKKIVGLISCEHAAGVVEIHSLIVDEAYRAKGYGLKLLQKAEDFAKKKGAHKMILQTREQWPAASFYRKYGFRKTCILKNHRFGYDFLLYSKYIK